MYAIKRSNPVLPMVLTGCLAALMLSSAATAFGASHRQDDLPRVIVRYHELDISRSAGARVLYKRIQRAAVKVCSHSVIPFSIPAMKTSSCYRNAIENAVAEVNSTQLYAIHRARATRVASE